MTYTRTYLDEMVAIAGAIDVDAVEAMVALLVQVRDRNGRVFVLGVGGGAANAAHAVSDLRTMAGIEAYAATDNTAALTALTNDRGWADSFAAWLQDSRINERDGVLVLSVGGGSVDPPVSENIVLALDLAARCGAATAGVVGRDGGETAKRADVCVLVPIVTADRVTVHTESFQAAIWHLAVSHPALHRGTPHWESIAGGRPAAEAR
jgi:D-sedoheptulose 7-phosphate isomerase